MMPLRSTDLSAVPYLEFGDRAFVGRADARGRVVVIDSPREVDRSLVAIDAARDVLVHAAYMAAPVAVSLLRKGFRGFVGIDAGIGRNDAGVGGLVVADAQGVPAAAVSVYSCAMCVGRSVWQDGVVSRVNGAAAAFGAEPGQSAATTAALLLAAPEGAPQTVGAAVPDVPVLLDEGIGRGRVWGCWSMSLVHGTHGGDVFCVGTPVDTVMAVYIHRHGIRPAGVIGSDGGFGRDRMAIAGLPILDDMGIACAAVSHLSADLGDGGSIFRDGRITRANAVARKAGVAAGMAAAEAADALLRHAAA